MSNAQARITGVHSTLAVKAPCRVATTANIALSGLQTIDGVALAADDPSLRVLVKDQDTASENGIYVASSGNWIRAVDFDGNTDVVKGTRVYVANGTVGVGEYVVTATDPIVIDTSNITIDSPSDAVVLLAQLGIGGAIPDATNRLSVNSPAILFNHAGDDSQVKVNKAATGDTASFLFQNGFSGRAEIGLIGDDDFSFKVSPDGSAFVSAVTIDKDNGYVIFPLTDPGLKDYGAVGNGVADDTAAITAADATAVAKYAPPGIYDTTIGQADLDGPYWGFGQIRDSANNLRGPWFSAIKAAPSVGDQTSVLTAFNGDLSGVQIAMEHRVTGAATAGQPTTGYMVRSEICPIFMFHYTESGHNQATDSNAGRTGQAMLDLNFAHTGQGDMGGIFVNGIVTGAKPGATSFLANPAAVVLYGQLFAAATGAYLNVIELNANDNGFQSAAIGAVFNFERTVATATLGEVWMGLRPQSSGSVPPDVVYSVGGNWKRGLDLSPGGFDSEAAITLEANQRIYGNAVPSGEVQWSITLNDDWLEFNSGINAWSFVNGNVSQFQIYSNQVVTVPLAIFQNDVVVNHTAATVLTPGVTPRIQLHGDGGSTSAFGQARYSNGATGAAHIFAKSRNATIGSHTIVQQNDTLGIMHFNGSDGANFINGALIEARCTGTPGTNDMPASLLFHTTPDGAAASVERLRISHTGSVLAFAPLGGLGYGTGAGGAVTQLVGRTQGVQLDTICGAITLVNAVGVGTWTSFTVTNSTVAIGDTVIPSVRSSTSTYVAAVTAVANGSFRISFAAAVIGASDTPIINFSVIKAVAS